MKNTEEVIFEGYPKRMIVWTNDGRAHERIVLCCVPRYGHPYLTITDDGIKGSWQHARDITPEKPRIIKDGLQQGDVIVNRRSKKVKIMGVVGEAIFTSASNDWDFVCPDIETINKLISKGWTLESESTAQEPAFVELTTQDISEGKGVGVDPKLIRIKE